MVRLIEQTLQGGITGLGFIERYGGIVKTVTMRKLDEEGRTIQQSFPVSCAVTGASCFEEDKYKFLTPNDAVASVAYFEQRGGSEVTTEGPRRRGWVMQENLRFVCWLNYPKLGLDDCKGPERFALAFLSVINGIHTVNTDSITGRLNITSTRILERDHRIAFGRYTYQDLDWAFFWPYDFFAVDLTCRVDITGKCIDDVDLGTPVDCVTTY